MSFVVGTFVTAGPVLVSVIPGELFAEPLSCFQCRRKILSGHNSADKRETETFETQWLITQKTY
jgi:hypothetical protein